MKRVETRKKRRGRPPLPDGACRDCRVVTFVTPKELEILHSEADAAGVAISGIVYKLIRQGLDDNKKKR